MHAPIYKKLVWLLLCCACISACTKDKPDTPQGTLPPSGKNRVLFFCEGVYGTGNARLDVYFPGKDSLYADVYQTANHGPMGDVLQSGLRAGSRYFFSINNSDKILVVDTSGFAKVAEIGMPKPRYFQAVSGNRAYVGSLYSAKLFVLNTQTNSIERSIALPRKNVEGMLLVGNKMYICCWDTACNHLYEFDVHGETITDSIALPGRAPQQVLQLQDGKLWVSGGNSYQGKPSFFACVDMASKSVVRSFAFPSDVEVIKPALNPTKDTVYFLKVDYSGGARNNGVFRMRASDVTLPETPFVSAPANTYFWALGIDPANGNIYVGDPKGFVQQSDVRVHDPAGNMLHMVRTGVGISSFYFE